MATVGVKELSPCFTYDALSDDDVHWFVCRQFTRSCSPAI